MSQSWRAFVFGAVDRQGTLTIDKSPGFLARADQHSAVATVRRPVLAMWLLWLVTTFAVVSAGHISHTAYVLALAPPIAVLFGASMPVLVRLYRRNTSG